MDISVDTIIALIALIFSGYATWQSSKVNALNRKLNELLIQKEEDESKNEKKADLGVNFVKVGKNRRLKVFNKGRSNARNVRIEFPEGNDVLIESDLKSKFPHECLERHQSVEVIAAVHMQTKPKHTIKLIWDDDYSNDNEKTLYPTL